MSTSRGPRRIMLGALLLVALAQTALAQSLFSAITQRSDGSGLAFAADGTAACGFYQVVDVSMFDWMTSNLDLVPTAFTQYVVFSNDAAGVTACPAPPSFRIQATIGFDVDAFVKPAVYWMAFVNEQYAVARLAPSAYFVADSVMTVTAQQEGMAVIIMPSEVIVLFNETLTLPPMQLPWTFRFALGTLGAFSIARYVPSTSDAKTVVLLMDNGLAYGQPLLDFLNDPAFVRSAASDVFQLYYTGADAYEPATILIGTTTITPTTRVAHLDPDTGVWYDAGGTIGLDVVSVAVPAIHGSWMLIDSVARVCAPGLFGSACARCPACSAGERCDDGFAGSGTCMCAAQRINSLGVPGGPSAGGGCRCLRPLAWGADCAHTCGCAARMCSDQDGCRAASNSTAIIVCLSVGSVVGILLCALMLQYRRRRAASGYSLVYALKQSRTPASVQMMPRVLPLSQIL